jgi:CRISPR-associated protein Cas1
MSTIYIVSDSGKLQKKQDTLQHYAQDGTITKVFPYKTEQLVILGNVELTGPALKLLMHHNVDTVFVQRNMPKNNNAYKVDSDNKACL